MSHQETIEFDIEQPEKKSLRRCFYTVPQVLFGVFLGGPLAGVFMMRRNYVTMGEEDKASALGFWGLASVVLYLLAGFLLLKEVSGTVVQAAVCAVFTAYIHNTQRAAIHEMEAKGIVQRFTHWRMVGSVLASVAVTFFVGLLIMWSIYLAAPELYVKLFPGDPSSVQENVQVQGP